MLYEITYKSHILSATYLKDKMQGLLENLLRELSITVPWFTIANKFKSFMYG